MNEIVRLPIFGEIEDVRILEYDDIEEMDLKYIGTNHEAGIFVYENKIGGIYFGCRTEKLNEIGEIKSDLIQIKAALNQLGAKI